jgi:excisionase family DNA binding protein
MSDVSARWLSIRTAAQYLSISPRTCYSWALDGTIKGVVRIHRRHAKGRGRHVCTVRIDRLALDRWLEARAR